MSHHRPRSKHIWCPGCQEKVSHLWNQRCFNGSEGKEIMRCELCIITDFGTWIKTLRSALAKSTQALDDWTSTYASEFCDEARVEAAWKRINANGGTLAYIAGIVTSNHKMLKR